MPVNARDIFSVLNDFFKLNHYDLQHFNAPSNCSMGTQCLNLCRNINTYKMFMKHKKISFAWEITLKRGNLLERKVINIFFNAFSK